MTTATDTRRSFVTCRAAGELLAFDVGTVERVLRYSPPAALPNSAPWLRGVIGVGGQLLPVLDLRERLGLPPLPRDDSHRVLVLNAASGRIGFIVDGVEDVAAVDGLSVEPAPAVYRGLARAFVQGILRRGTQLYILLDADHLVNSHERLALSAAVEELQYGR